MRVLIASNDDHTTAKIRQALVRHNIDCPITQVVSLDMAVGRLDAVRPDLVLLVLTPDPERGLVALQTLRSATSARLAAVGVASEPRQILRALHEGGADAYVDLGELDSQLAATLAHLKPKTVASADAGRVTGVLAPSGGSGASTVAVNLATAIAQQRKTCGLLDLNFEVGDLAALLDLKPAHSLLDVCRNSRRIDRSLFEQLFTRHENGVHLLASPRAFGGSEGITADGIRQAISMARVLFPHVVVDLDNSFRREETDVFLLADTILLVFRLDFASLRNVGQTADRLKELGISAERLQFVANRCGQPREVPVATAEDVLGMKVLQALPDDPKSVLQANNNGVPVVVENPRAKVSRLLVDMARQLDGTA